MRFCEGVSFLHRTQKAMGREKGTIMSKATEKVIGGPMRRLVRSCWVHTCTTAYRRTLLCCPKCGGSDYDACGQERSEYQCVDCGTASKIADLQPTGKSLYDADCKERPTYHDGTPRKRWDQLGDVEQWSWNRPKTSSSSTAGLEARIQTGALPAVGWSGLFG